MPSGRFIARVERLAWVFTFAGLATLVLGLATRDFDSAAAWTLTVAGAVLAVAGVGLIWRRSRLDDGPS